MVKIKGRINRDHYQTLSSNGRRELIGDEPVENGGSDLGFSPTELLCTGLVTCTCITLRMYADRKNWPLESVEVMVSLEKDAIQNFSRIQREIRLTGDLSREQQNRLMEIAAQCPVHWTLAHPIQIKTSFL